MNFIKSPSLEELGHSRDVENATEIRMAFPRGPVYVCVNFKTGRHRTAALPRRYRGAQAGASPRHVSRRDKRAGS